MSDDLALGSVLADPSLACTGFIARSERARYLAAANALGFTVAAIDFGGCTGKDDALARFARALRFPDWFGGNWDALADVLRDLSWLPAPGYLLLIENAAQWRAANGGDFDTLLDILNEAAFEWARQDVNFWALLPFPADQLTALED